jgi:hypothetical protein
MPRLPLLGRNAVATSCGDPRPKNTSFDRHGPGHRRYPPECSAAYGRNGGPGRGNHLQVVPPRNSEGEGKAAPCPGRPASRHYHRLRCGGGCPRGSVTRSTGSATAPPTAGVARAGGSGSCTTSPLASTASRPRNRQRRLCVATHFDPWGRETQRSASAPRRDCRSAGGKRHRPAVRRSPPSCVPPARSGRRGNQRKRCWSHAPSST